VAPGGAYQVLARKYRPQTFEDLIGQEAMVRTLANAFRLGRIAQAYMLTGVRGVGKTTTARLIARALNYRSATVDAPSVHLDPPGEQCAAIAESRHPDVFEMDAASRTGINDIREILDSVRYGPIQARMKVYIIDEVHMLSTAAFNGLLKTLEEPPPHAKFIFATTEIRKVPVTVLSRCQRFDLRRVEADRLAQHLAGVCAKEGAQVEAEGLDLIARAAEGSVRDALSLLDQAIVQTLESGEMVSAAQVRDMLGLADRARVLDLLEAVARGDAAGALTEFQGQYAAGADPALILRDLMDASHEASVAKALGAAHRIPGARDQAARVRALADGASAAALTRQWQLLLKGWEETTRAPDAVQAAEMTLLRCAAAASLPSPEDAARLLAGGSGGGLGGGMGQGAPGGGPPAAGPQSFADILARLDADREIGLKTDVEAYLRVARFDPDGEIGFALAEGAPSDLAQRLLRFIQPRFGAHWRLAPEAAPDGVETFAERRAREKLEQWRAVEADAGVRAMLEAFPGARIVAITPPDGGEVIEADFQARAGRQMRGQDG
jgi:DNA polymerase-3 subunit gamma/tau